MSELPQIDSDDSPWSVATIYINRASSFTSEQLEMSLWEMGAEGVITENTLITAYFKEEDISLTAKLNQFLLPYNLSATVKPVENKNWVQECSKLMESLVCDNFTVKPISTAKEAESPTPDLIQIIPGMGFGTGHHEATYGALKLMQSQILRKDKIFRVCDVGTGSGILAIGAAKYFFANVVANDIDVEALANAKENVEINGVQSLVTLTEDDFSIIEGPFDLIIANIYAEVLCQLEPNFRDKLRRNGVLILSGIMASLYPAIEECFTKSYWDFLTKDFNGDWVSIMLRKK